MVCSREDFHVIVRINSDAEDDLRNAFSYYQTINELLGSRLIDDYHSAIRKVAEHPNRWPTIGEFPRVHYYRLDHFPYKVVYQLNSDDCMILAFMHISREPGYWQTRY